MGHPGRRRKAARTVRIEQIVRLERAGRSQYATPLWNEPRIRSGPDRLTLIDCTWRRRRRLPRAPTALWGGAPPVASSAGVAAGTSTAAGSSLDPQPTSANATAPTPLRPQTRNTARRLTRRASRPCHALRRRKSFGRIFSSPHRSSLSPTCFIGSRAHVVWTTPRVTSY